MRALRVIGLGHVIVGILGLIVVIRAFTRRSPDDVAWLVHLGVLNQLGSAILFAVAVAGGLAVLTNRIVGLRICLSIQMLSILWFAIKGGPHIQIAASPRMSIDVSSYALGVSAGFDAVFFLGTRVAGPAFEFHINLLALLWSYAIWATLRSSQSPMHASVPAV